MNTVFRIRSLFIVIPISICVLSSSGCGSKQNPTGGKQDLEKLKLMATMPEEFAEIKNSEIELTFSKSVDQTSFLRGMYIYPPIEKKKIYYESNVITIRFLEALEKDTNYFLTLTTRIKDTRGNTLDANQTLTFSHGVLQSNRISGNIEYEKQEDEGLPIQLNLLSADSLWVRTQTVTGKSYALQSLNQMDFILRAHIDKNNNGRYDAEQEPYFEASAINQPVNNINLTMAYADTVKPVIKFVRAISNREYEIVLNKAVISFQSVTVSDMIAQENVRIFALDHEMDKINVLTATTDSTELRFMVTNLRDAKANLTDKSTHKIKSSTKPDKTPPFITSTTPRNGASVNDLKPVIEIVFSEVIPSSMFKARLIEVESKRTIPFTIIKLDSKKYLIQPEDPLANYKACQLTIEETTSDLSGNKLSEAFNLTFLPIIRNINQ